MEPIVILASGGMNSTVAACRALTDACPHFLFVDYGQASAAAQREAVKQIARSLGGRFAMTMIRASASLSAEEAGMGAGSAGQPGDAGEDEATCASGEGAGRRPPGVMLAMIGVAQRLAFEVGAEEIVCGASELCSQERPEFGFGSSGSDSTRAFLHASRIALEMGASERRRIRLDVPLVDVCRADVVRIGLRLGAPFHLTWSCEEAGDRPCGVCFGCRSRAAAFSRLGQDDPLAANVGQGDGAAVLADS